MPKKKGETLQVDRVVAVIRRLHTGAGVTYDWIINEHGVDWRTAVRDIELIRTHFPLYGELDEERRKVWRLQPSARLKDFRMTKGELISLYIALKIFRDFAGTDLEGDLKDVVGKLEPFIDENDEKVKKSLHKKLYVIEDAPKIYKQFKDVLDDIQSGLINERKIEVVYKGWEGDKTHIIEPYALLYYRHGLYLYGRSDLTRGGFITLALDRIKQAKWLPGQGFKYDRRFNPEKEFENAFHIITGEPERVEIAFLSELKDYIKARHWHKTQKITTMKDGRIKLAMEIFPGVELISWLLSFGHQAQLLKPERMRKEMKKSIKEMGKRYR
ncbi:MAG: hypothetical protein Kow0090_04510 [Myxococcota bacterium]